MRIPRVYLPTACVVGETVVLDKEASHYLRTVLRVSAGQAIQCFDGSGYVYALRVDTVEAKKLSLSCLSRFQQQNESPLKLTLAQAISRGEKMDYTIQKAVELGVNTIVPVVSERVGVSLDKERAKSRLAHWRKVIVSACEQSGRSYLPELKPIISLEAYLQTLNVQESRLKLILNPHDEAQIKAFPSVSELELLVGPEGGFTETECALAVKQGFQSWQLGPRILRTETAALAAISILQFKLGDF